MILYNSMMHTSHLADNHVIKTFIGVEINF